MLVLMLMLQAQCNNYVNMYMYMQYHLVYDNSQKQVMIGYLQVHVYIPPTRYE